MKPFQVHSALVLLLRMLAGRRASFRDHTTKAHAQFGLVLTPGEPSRCLSGLTALPQESQTLQHPEAAYSHEYAQVLAARGVQQGSRQPVSSATFLKERSHSLQYRYKCST